MGLREDRRMGSERFSGFGLTDLPQTMPWPDPARSASLRAMTGCSWSLLLVGMSPVRSIHTLPQVPRPEQVPQLGPALWPASSQQPVSATTPLTQTPLTDGVNC